ncbi:MAG: bifunctional diaminohydroxyphosphoribosylaminopyrimidine deaminase/5-amino-6-(5-phosphoribosylamino)uracil reductase RibD [Firmicutes bacterium]|nr:bifunctional diaminohydroxyphosphoribosylaminopyrimidine deaminase/5-amino-6-(5-phosphoribosylamino)uracil reductase RibD [Bacillota bacterium]
MSHEEYMRLALTLARAAKGRTSPNPIVGAVIVQGDRVVGMGAHLKAGTPHAEVHALQMAGPLAKGATVYVTLEPCAHFGRTPPCADALIASGVGAVYVALEDPNPAVAGLGIARLRAAGIMVSVGLLAEVAQEDNRPYLHYRKTGRAHVTFKSAMSMDGFIASSNPGAEPYLTGVPARDAVHRLRDQVDGIAVGVGTVLADDPLLTTRLADGIGKNPVRIVFDSQLRTPVEAQILRDRSAPTWLLCGQEASAKAEALLNERGARVLRFATADDGHLPLADVLTRLGQEGILDLLLEGGQTLATRFLQAQLVDLLWLFHAPVLLGGGVKVLGAELGVGIRLAHCQISQIGQDTLTVAKPVYAADQEGGSRCLQD